jgi:uncharacterized protein YukE
MVAIDPAQATAYKAQLATIASELQQLATQIQTTATNLGQTLSNLQKYSSESVAFWQTQGADQFRSEVASFVTSGQRLATELQGPAAQAVSKMQQEIAGPATQALQAAITVGDQLNRTT